MKKIIFLLLFIPSISFSQSFGLKGGINFSNSSISTSEIFTGFSVGGFYNQKLTNILSFQGELLYTRYGYDNKLFFTNNSGNPKFIGYEKFRFSKIELPLFIKATAKSGAIKPFAYLGFSPGINISGRFSPITLDNNNNIIHLDSEKLSTLNTFSISMIPGIGFSVKDHLYFDARYAIGLTNTIANSRISTFYITAGYSF